MCGSYARPGGPLLDEREHALDVLGRVHEGGERRPEPCVHLLDERPEIARDAPELADDQAVAVRQEPRVEPRPGREHGRRGEVGLADHARDDRRLRLANGHEARQAPIGAGDQVGGSVQQVREPHRPGLGLLEGDRCEDARASREPVDHRLGVVADDHVPVLPPGQREVGRGARQPAAERPSHPACRRREPAVGTCDHGARVRWRAAGVKQPRPCEVRLKFS